MLLELAVATIVSAEEWSPPPLVPAGTPVLDARTLTPPPAPPAVEPLSVDEAKRLSTWEAFPSNGPPPPPPLVPPQPPTSSSSSASPRNQALPSRASSPISNAPSPPNTLEASRAQATPATATTRSTPPASEERAASPEKPDDGPLWQVSALATATTPTALEAGLPFMVGFRAELDVWRLSALVTLDRTGTTPFTLAETQHWTALAGASLFSSKWLRVRALGGVSAQSSSAGSTLAPTLGLNGRLFWRFIGIEAASTLTPFGAFQQLDGRVELVLRAGIFELHAGYRARWLPTGIDSLISTTPLAGPQAAIGLTL